MLTSVFDVGDNMRLMTHKYTCEIPGRLRNPPEGSMVEEGRGPVITMHCY